MLHCVVPAWSGVTPLQKHCLQLGLVALSCIYKAHDAASAQLMLPQMIQHSDFGSSCLSQMQQSASVHLSMIIPHCCYKLCTFCYKSASCAN